MSINPVSTYRVQFSPDFKFSDFKKIIPYLRQLGIKTIYASPIFEAVPGSSHGYDVTNPLKINPQIGTIEELYAISKELNKQRMLWIQDIVPNHMAFSVQNPWLRDVLRKGKRSAYANFFDIDWNHPTPELKGRLMVPFLGKSLKEVVEGQELIISMNGTGFILKYYDNEYPLKPEDYTTILKNPPTTDIRNALGKFNKLLESPNVNELALQKAEKELINHLTKKGKPIEYVEQALRDINHKPAQVLKLAENQHYLLTHWQETEKQLNYRRFFTINGMICLRMESRKVFDAWHQLIRQLCRDEVFHGLRVDHVDGLYDPEKYLERLRQMAGDERYIIIEKILEKNEYPEHSWPIEGTSGYEFLGMVNNLFTNEENRKSIDKAYQYVNDKRPEEFDYVIYRKKKFILEERMAGDLDNLLQYFNSLRFTEKNSVDKTNLRKVLSEFLLHCPVYKIYESPETFSPAQRQQVVEVFDSMEQTEQGLGKEFQFLKKLFLPTANSAPEDVKSSNKLFRRCMQFTGPLMAKGGEDTAYYTYSRLIGHNEVGDSPAYFGISTHEFHEEMSYRQSNFPLTMSTTSTHDTKRGEDARARLNVISDLPCLWIEHVRNWQASHFKLKNQLDDRDVPSQDDTYFIYQSIMASMPVFEDEDSDFQTRLKAYMTKVLREGKRESNWSSPDEEYEQETLKFIDKLLSSEEGLFPSDPLLVKIAYFGRINSLAEVILRYTLPGVPDTYQGSESWNFSFVDPDNRRKVDYQRLSKLLTSFAEEEQSNTIPALTESQIKFWLVHKLLQFRLENPELFLHGEYIPIQTKGKHHDKIFGYARRYHDQVFLVVIPLHLASFFDNDSAPDIAAIDWEDTSIEISDEWTADCTNIMDGSKLKLKKSVYISSLFSNVPFAIMSANIHTSPRRAGIIMHVTSLPGEFASGDMGPEAYKYADFLFEAGQRTWQILPLNQVDPKSGYSPYSPLSAFAGNTLLISPEILLKEGLIKNLPKVKTGKTKPGKADFATGHKIRKSAINEAFFSFMEDPDPSIASEFEAFCSREEFWLEDYALFMVLRAEYDQKEWFKWPAEYRDRKDSTLDNFRRLKREEIEREKFGQFLFFRQWQALKDYCHAREIEIFGDVPIYISHDSADVWAHADIFRLKKDKKMEVVAGVPPDYFNEDGQYWNMPIYNWQKLQDNKYYWWMERLKKNLQLFDLVRLDHFRGFSAYWEIPANEETAKNGKWVKGPGKTFFDEVKKQFPDMPFIAEDLGDIDQAVYDLRDRYKLPGMRVLQFCFGGDFPHSLHIPHHHTENSVAYSGTHDNNTISGWYKDDCDKPARKNVKNYLGGGVKKKNIHKRMIRQVYQSTAKIAILPMQDLLGLGSKARMNFPSTTKGNWTWRMQPDSVGKKDKKWLRKLARTYGRR